MYLSKLELHGFKSFAQRTVVQFDPGVTAIVGPNGCGKSNIVDAVRWVIGEQRARILRSEKMENVIFNGTSKRRALGMAEVLLTVQNNRGVLPTEYTEVTLGRRLYRSGESEYLLNGVKCRLQDITDLFMDTGMGAGAYSVIELKMIEEILSENAQDRRRLFEEAAGITRYKLRRKQALSKLDGTQADLTRLRDLTEEIDKQVRSLKRQAEKASRFKEYQERLVELERALARAEFDRLDTQQQTLRSELARIREQIDANGHRQSVEEAALEALRLRLVQDEEAVAAQRQRINSYMESVRAMEAERRLLAERIEAYRRDKDRLLGEQEASATRRTELEEVSGRTTASIAAAEPRLEEARQKLDAARHRRDLARETADEQREELQELRQREQRAIDRHTALRRDVDRLASRIELLEAEQDRLTAATDTASDATGEIEARVTHTARQLEEAKLRAETARADLAGAVADLETARADLDEATELLRGTERRREALGAEVNVLESLVASYEEFSDAVQFLAATPEWTTTQLKTVADVLRCEDRYRIALDTALGEFGSCIVVEDAHEAGQAVSLLRAREKGQATFILMDRIRRIGPPEVGAHPIPGVPLRELVQAEDPVYEPLADLLLHGSYVAESLDEARSLAGEATPPARFFVPTGEWVDADGRLRGGSEATSASPVASRMGRREQLARARQSLIEAEGEFARQREIVLGLRATLESIPHEALRRGVSEAERAVADAERAHTRSVLEREGADTRMAELEHRLETLRQELDAARAGHAESEQALGQAEALLSTARSERATVEEAFHAAEAESRAALTGFNDANVASIQAQNLLENLRRDLERTTREIAGLDTRQVERAEELERIESEVARAMEQQEEFATRLAEVQAGYEGLDTALSEAEMAYRETRAGVSEAEARLRTLRQEREQQLREENNRSVRLAEIETRLEDLVSNVQEHHGISLQEAAGAVPADFDEAAAREQVLDLRNKIRLLGAVNALALESYEEERQRLEFLTAQQRDLESAEKTLLDTIDEINSTAAQRFFETYEAIRDSFRRIFADLFGEEATADLELADPNDPLESPIEIMAKPRGKRPSSISQLSGGEKTLTAIALLFSIYLVKPSPFCILDEVDAPLDDTNVERFMQLIRNFSSETQFILVTHNKRTMEAADRMYGITMQEQGISKLVGVRFDETIDLLAEEVPEAG